MNTSLSTGLRPEWLALRESADGDARAVGLLDPLNAWLAARSGPGLVIRDLGCGTGSMGRWLAGRLPGPQHWILHDKDRELLARAAEAVPAASRDGQPVTVATQPGDLTGLTATDLAGTSLVTAAALLDLLTAAEIDALAAACVAAGCPALLTLSVLGRVEFDPVEPLDEELQAAFNDHQRRDVAGRRLLGPDAFDAAATAFGALGAVVYEQPSLWRLGPDDAGLTAEWLPGWVAAAIERRPELAEPGQAYVNRRLKANAAGELRVVVTHGDLLAIPRSAA